MPQNIKPVPTNPKVFIKLPTDMNASSINGSIDNKKRDRPEYIQ